MEFTITCPIDGPVEVSLEDIDNVVLRDSDRADITFVCPHCGTEVAVSAIVPAFLLAAIEALADDPEAAAANGIMVVSSDLTDDSIVDLETDVGFDVEPDDPRFDAYCEYFRRQLAHVECVEDALSEIDAHS